MLVVVLASAALVPLAIFLGGPVRIALGLVFVLFSPGYSLIAALFPKRNDLDGVERLALSFALSIAVIPLIGLVLNFTPWGIRLYPILVSVLTFIVVMAAVSWYRRGRLPENERFGLDFHFHLSSLRAIWTEKRRLDRILSGLLIVAIMAAVGTLVYLVQTPKTGDKFTEFYLLGPQGKAENYPRELILGAKTAVIVGIVNREHEPISYNVEVTVDGAKVVEVGPVALAHTERWEQEVSFAPTETGEHQKVEFLLYKGTSKDVCQELHFWIDVFAPK